MLHHDAGIPVVLDEPHIRAAAARTVRLDGRRRHDPRARIEHRDDRRVDRPRVGEPAADAQPPFGEAVLPVQHFAHLLEQPPRHRAFVERPAPHLPMQAMRAGRAGALQPVEPWLGVEGQRISMAARPVEEGSGHVAERLGNR